jgi:hypothetical protein
VLGAVRDKDGDCTLFRMKSNIGKDGEGFRYDIETIPLGEENETTRITWGEHVKATASEIVRDSEADPDENDKHGNKLNAAIHLLRNGIGDWATRAKCNGSSMQGSAVQQ